jgi:hypothetical protein
VYVTVDDYWQTIAHRFSRPGPKPVCSDSELLTMVLVGECCGWDVETEMLHHWQAHRDLFPQQPTQSRLNRRRRQLTDALALLRQWLVRQLDLAAEQICIIDSLPLSVVASTTPRGPRLSGACTMPAMAGQQARSCLSMAIVSIC